MRKSMLSAISALGCLSLATMTAEAKLIWKFRSNGASATFEAYSEAKEYEYFNVFKGGTPQSPETYVSYHWSDCDWSTNICHGVNAYGRIPNQDFHATEKTANLHTNTTGNPDFSANAWTLDHSTGEYSESPIALGVIDLSWRASGENSSTFTGTNTQTNLTFTWKTTGQSSLAHATVAGTIGGEAVQASYGQLGTNSSSDKYLERQ